MFYCSQQKKAALGVNVKLKEINFCVNWNPALVPLLPPSLPLLLSLSLWKCLVFARGTKLEAINLSQTPLLWLQTLGAESGGKEEQEVAEKSFISPQDSERLHPVLRRQAASGQLFVAKWILSGSGISAECTLPRPLQVLLIIQFQIKLQKAANAVLMLGGKGHKRLRSSHQTFWFYLQLSSLFPLLRPVCSAIYRFFLIRLYDQPEIYVPFSRRNSRLRFNRTRGLFFLFLHFSGKTLKTDKAVNAVDKMFNCQPTFVVIIYVMIIIIIHLSINSLFIIKSQSATNKNMLRWQHSTQVYKMPVKSQ